MNTIDEAIEVLQGIKDGKAIQSALEGYKWEDRDDTYNDDLPDFYNLAYRVKPEPREWTMTVCPRNERLCNCPLYAAATCTGAKDLVTVIEVIE